MGGTVAVGVINKEGELRTTLGSIKSLINAVKNSKFAHGDIATLGEYINYYGANGSEQGYGFANDVPDSHGYVLFDLCEETVLGAQKHTYFSRILGTEIETLIEKDEEEADRMARIITHLLEWDDEVQDKNEIAVGPFKDARSFIAYDKTNKQLGEDFSQYKINYPAWKIIDGKCDASSILIVRDYLNERNLLGDNDLVIWDKIISSHSIDNVLEEVYSDSLGIRIAGR